jgi:putative protease
MIEILAPGGSPEALNAAVAAGANAVYVGLKRFSARASAVNFTPESLSEAVKFCRAHNTKIYLALNTLLHHSDIDEFVKTIEDASGGGVGGVGVTGADTFVDGFIVQDLGAVNLLRERFPKIPLHASTQMTIHNKSGIDFAKMAGFSRVVLARELSKNEIKTLAEYALEKRIETEVFVYGALCFAVSGQCYMSAFFDGGKRSANSGTCAGACRLPFSAGNKFKPEDRALSLKDQNLAPYVRELAEMGVTSLKIEGRLKGSDYVKTAVRAIRMAEPKQKNMTDGYYTGKIYDCFGKRDNQT